jgi:hypothetical protein
MTSDLVYCRIIIYWSVNMVLMSKVNLFDLELMRLQRKGVKNNIIAFVLLVVFFFVSHRIGKIVWSHLVDLYLS